MAVTANITVSFGSDTVDAGSHLSAEIDSRESGLNGGDTSFVPGDTAYFFVYQSANVTHDQPVASAGTIVSTSAGVVEREEDISFSDTDTATLPVPATAITSVKWLGRSLGSLELTDEMTLKASASGVAMARIKYNTEPAAYGIQSVDSIDDETDYSILIFIAGQES